MKQKEFFTFLISLFLAVTIPVGIFLFSRVQTLEKRAEGGPASLQLTTNKENPSAGDAVDFTIRLDPGGEQVYGANILITFDSSVFEVIGDSVDTTAADYVFPKSVANEVRSGEVEFSPYIQPSATDYMETEGSVGMFSLRVKEGVSDGTTSLGFADNCTINEITNYEDVLGAAPQLSLVIGEGETAELASVSIQPQAVTLEVGQSQEFTATGYDNSGNQVVLSGNDFSWGHSPTELGSLNSCVQQPSDGSSCRKFTAEAEGTGVVQVTANQGDISVDAEASVTVPSLTPLDRVEVVPSSATVTVGGKQNFCGEGYNENDSRVPLGANDCQWEVSGGVGSITESSSACCAEFVGDTEGSGSVTLNATKSGETAEASAAVSVTADSQPLTCSISNSELTASVSEQLSLFVAAGGGTGSYSYQWSAQDSEGSSAGTFDSTTAASVIWTAPSAAEIDDGEEIIINITVSDGDASCEKSITVTMEVPTPTLSIDFQLENNVEDEGERTISLTLFAREENSSVGYGEAPWRSSMEVSVDESSKGSFSNMELVGLPSGQSYDFLLKGPQHLQVKKTVTNLGAANNLDFGVLPAGDVGSPGAGPPDNRVDSYDIGLWTRDWSPWELTESSADVNKNGYVDSFDYTYIHRNFGKEGDQ